MINTSNEGQSESSASIEIFIQNTAVMSARKIHEEQDKEILRCCSSF